MRAMTLRRAGDRLAIEERPEPEPGPGEIRLRVEACGVCRTDLHVVDGELPDPKLPIVPGHEIVGRVEAAGRRASRSSPARGSACPGSAIPAATAPIAWSGRENLCDAPLFTGYTRDGGFADPRDRRRRLRLPARRGSRSGRRGTAALRRPDRLAVAQGGRRRRDDRPLRLRRGRAHHRPGVPMAGTAGVRLHQAGRRGRPGFRPVDGRGMGRRLGREAARRRSTRRSCSLRPARSSRRRSRRSARAAGWSAAAST